MTIKDDKPRINNIIQWSITCLIALILLFSVSRYTIEKQDKDRCHSLLNQGHWETEKYDHWRPTGCMARDYDVNKITSCIGRNTRILYIGDSIMREQYFAMATILGMPTPLEHEVHEDLVTVVEKKNITLELWWDPYINTQRTLDLLNNKNHEKISLLIMGSSAWYMKNSGETYFEDWKEAVDRVFKAAIKYPIADKMLLAPVETVVVDMLSPGRRKTITPDKIDRMNLYLQTQERALSQENLVTPLAIPFVWNEIVGTSKNQTLDGLHYNHKVERAEAMVALNYRCNNDPNVSRKEYPYDVTCCYTYPQPAWYQSAVLFYFLVFTPIGFFLYYLPSNRVVNAIRYVFPSDINTITSMFVFGLGMIYMFLGDRTQLFGKFVKHYDVVTYSVLCGLTLLVGILTTKQSGASDKSYDAGFLNRDQTDEWKGWMQLAILIYHFVGALEVSYVYNLMRALVAAYLFQTGYGHFLFFYRKADFGVGRVMRILVRLNLLTCVLCYLMKTDYLFYYFSPLVTFWFIVIWTTMRVWSSKNNNTWFLLAKIGVMSILTGFFIHYPGILEAVLDSLKYCFNIHWHVTNWRIRLALDAWIVYIGMLVGLLTIKLKPYHDHPLWTPVKLITVVLSAIGLVGYLLFESVQTKENYVHYHPYVSWIPVLSFVVLRNAHRTLRNSHSRMFAFVGKISLETYIGQFHMWLAADSKGLLALIEPRWVESGVGWYGNFLVSSVVFLFVCYQLGQATGVLTQAICSGTDKKKDRPDLDAAPLLPTQGGIEEEIEEDWEKISSKPTWYRRLFASLNENYWLKMVAFLILFGLVNRWC